MKVTGDLMKELGQKPISAKKEINGFILNRLQYALIMEAWRLVEVGGCDKWRRPCHAHRLLCCRTALLLQKMLTLPLWKVWG